MGNCSCLEKPKETPEALLVAAAISDSPASVAYKVHEHVMMPEVKSLYRQFLMKKSNSVSTIDIQNKEIKELDSELISKLMPEVPNLKELRLVNNGLGFGGANKLSDNLSTLSNLQKLIISNNKIDDEGLELIAQTMSFMPKLVEINFSNNQITPIGAEKLEEVLSNLEDLETFDISGNQLSKRTLLKLTKAVKGIKSLKRFIFEEKNLKDADVAAVKKDLPNVHFTYEPED